MFLKEEILELVLSIRKERGMEDSYPVIKDVLYNSHLYIIVEDRPDKSILIGSSYVAGELRKRLGMPLTILAETDLVEKRRKIEENMKMLENLDTKYNERLLSVCKEEKKYPRNESLFFPPEGESFLVFCNNAYAVRFSEMLGLTPVVLTYKYSFPTTTKRLRCIEIEGDFQTCRNCQTMLLEEACEIARKNSIDIVFCNQDVALKKEGGVLFVDPQILLQKTDWELGRNERCLRIKGNRDDVGFWTSEISRRVYEGLVEPNEGAEKIYEAFKRGKA